MSFFEELRRRNVVRVGIAYAVVAWLLLQVADVLIDNIGAPDWVFRTLLLVIGIGFPLALVFAWAFEMTPEGIKRDRDVDPAAAATAGTGRRLDRLIIVALVLALAYFVYESRFSPGTAEPASVEPEPAMAQEATEPAQAGRSVAVLPFVNMSSDPEREYFSDGITEEIINAVVKIPGVSVPARTTVFAYKGHQRDLREVGAELGVSHILEGSIRSQADQVRVTAQLIKVDDGFHLWSETYDRQLDNIFAVQEEIAAAIARQLTGELQGGVTTVPNRTRNMEAYDLYLKGRAALRQRADASRDLLHAAIEADPDFAPAYAALAIAYQSTNEDNDMALVMAEKALAIDPENVDALNAKGAALRTQRNWLEAEALLEQALAIDPNSAELLEDYAEFLAYTGRSAEALEITTRGIGLDPALLPLAAAHLEALLTNGKSAEAHSYALELMADYPDLPWIWLVAMPVWMDAANRAEHANLPPAPHFETQARGSAFELLAERTARVVAVAERVYAGTHDDGDIQLLRQEYGDSSNDNVPSGAERALLVSVGEADFLIGEDLARFDVTEVAMNEWNWAPLFSPLRQHPDFPKFLERAGLIAYWDATEWPDYCRRNDDGEVTCR